MKRIVNHIFPNESLGVDMFSSRVCRQDNNLGVINQIYFCGLDYRPKITESTVAVFRMRPATTPLSHRLSHIPNHLEIIASLKKNPKL